MIDGMHREKGADTMDFLSRLIISKHNRFPVPNASTMTVLARGNACVSPHPGHVLVNHIDDHSAEAFRSVVQTFRRSREGNSYGVPPSALSLGQFAVPFPSPTVNGSSSFRLRCSGAELNLLRSVVSPWSSSDAQVRTGRVTNLKLD